MSYLTKLSAMRKGWAPGFDKRSPAVYQSLIKACRYILYTLLISVGGISTADAQLKRLTDSLENLLQSGSVTGNARIDLSGKLATYFVKPNIERARLLANQTLTDELKANYKEGEGQAYLLFAMIYQQSGLLDSGLVYADKAIKILPAYPRKVIESGVCYQTKGTIYKSKKQDGDAITAFLEAIKYFEKGGYKAGVADAYVGIAILFVGQAQYEKAIEYHQKAQKLYEEVGLKSKVAQEFGNLGIVEMRMKHYQKTLNYHYQALAMYKILNDSTGIANIYNDLGATYMEMTDYKKALSFLHQSADMRQHRNELRDLSYTLNYLGLTYEKTGDKARAISYMKQAHALAVKLDNTKQIADAFEAMSDFYAHNRQLDSAYFYG